MEEPQKYYDKKLGAYCRIAFILECPEKAVYKDREQISSFQGLGVRVGSDCKSAYFGDDRNVLKLDCDT